MKEFLKSIELPLQLDAVFLETLLSIGLVILAAFVLWLILSRVLTSVEKRSTILQ